MNEIATIHAEIPATIEDLSKFVLVGREKMTAVRAEIRAIDKLGLAANVKLQKLAEAQDLGEIVLEAEARVGALTAEIPKATTNHKSLEIGGTSDFLKPKMQTVKELGFTQTQVEQCETLAKNPEMIEQAKAEARKKGEIVTRQTVLKAVKKKKREKETQELRDAAPETITGGTIHEGDLFNVIDNIPDKSIDLLFADPPYMILDEKWDEYEGLPHFLNFTKRWLDAVMPKLKDTGRLYVSFSQNYMYELYNLLKEQDFYGLNFGQTIIWNYRNNNKMFNRMLYRFAYEPIL